MRARRALLPALAAHRTSTGRPEPGRRGPLGEVRGRSSRICGSQWKTAMSAGKPAPIALVSPRGRALTNSGEPPREDIGLLHVRCPSPGALPAFWLAVSVRSNPPERSVLYEALALGSCIRTARAPGPSGGHPVRWGRSPNPRATLAYARSSSQARWPPLKRGGPRTVPDALDHGRVRPLAHG